MLDRTFQLGRTVVALLLLGLLLAFAACQKTAQDQIRIGAILPLSGAGAGIGSALKSGLELGVREINARGGVNGRQLSIIYEDTQSEPRNSVAAFKKLVELEGLKIIFTITSSSGMVLKPLAERGGVLLFADVSHPEMTRDTQYVLRHSNIVDSDAAVMAEALLKNNHRRVGVLFQNDDWGMAYAAALKSALAEHGVEMRSEFHLPQDTDYRAQLLRLGLKDLPALVNLSVGSASGVAVKQSRELGFTGDIYSGVGFILTPDARVAAGDAAKGVYYQTYPRNSEFVQDYRRAYGTDPPLFAQVGYTDVELLAAAISRTSSEEPSVLSRYLRSLGKFRGRFEEVEVKLNGDIPMRTVIERFE